MYNIFILYVINIKNGDVMKFIYVKNYLKSGREEKIKFFKFINKLENIKLMNQKLLLSEHSILLDKERLTLIMNENESKKVSL